jgi:hypothetical protein
VVFLKIGRKSKHYFSFRQKKSRKERSGLYVSSVFVPDGVKYSYLFGRNSKKITIFATANRVSFWHEDKQEIFRYTLAGSCRIDGTGTGESYDDIARFVVREAESRHHVADTGIAS